MSVSAFRSPVGVKVQVEPLQVRFTNITETTWTCGRSLPPSLRPPDGHIASSTVRAAAPKRHHPRGMACLVRHAEPDAPARAAFGP